VSKKICFKHNKNKNLVLLKMQAYFSPQILKPGYGPNAQQFLLLLEENQRLEISLSDNID